MDRHPFRPAHIHLIVSLQLLVCSNILTETLQVQREGYKTVTTQIFDRKDKYLDNDSVFAVKDSLIVDFKPLKGNPKATLELEYDIILAPQGE
jgi:catechol 1,2-dioxygenase